MNLIYDSLDCGYPSYKFPSYGKYGMVATSHALAAQAGMDMLRKGGNAIDAALATATCLTVLEPISNGIGGDAFAIISFEGKLYGLNASGPSPAGISLDTLKEKGYEEIPKYGFVPVNVPGTPASWVALAKRFGKLSLQEVFAPAIRYAEEGFPVSGVMNTFWDRAFRLFKKECNSDEFKHWFTTFAPNDKVPSAGELFRLPHHAKTLAAIAETEANSFYKGEIAQRLDDFSKRYGGYIRGTDLENYEVEWVEPISTHYGGLDVWEIPPNGQGIVALMALNILKGFDFSEKNCLETYHRQIEAIKLAFADAQRYVTDPRKMQVSVEDLLSDAWADEKRKLMGKTALLPPPTPKRPGGTVYLATADADGNMVSFIQSNYMGFGSGLVIPETGVALHNRGHNFSFDPAHDNALEPNKKPYHTIIPGFLTKGGKALGPFGVMGGFMQPQGHVQVVMNLVNFGHNPQEALDAPRWQWKQGKDVDLERTIPSEIIQGLKDKGHKVTVTECNSGYGRGQIILQKDNGLLVGGTETRIDGNIASW